MNFVMISQFFPTKRNLKKVKKLFTNLYNEYIIHIKNLKPALNHGLILKKVNRGIKFNQNVWGKTKSKKIILRKDFFKLMNNAGFGNTMGM